MTYGQEESIESMRNTKNTRNGWLRSCVASIVAAACLFTPVTTAAGVETTGPSSDVGVQRSDDQNTKAADEHPSEQTPTPSTLSSDDEQADAAQQPFRGGGSSAQNGGDIAPMDWSSKLDNLVVGSDGLTIRKAQADGPANAEQSDQSDTNQSETGNTLPDKIPATLHVTFTLDASAAAGRDDGSERTGVHKGDTFSVPLPQGFSATSDKADTSANEFDIVQREETKDDQGNTVTDDNGAPVLQDTTTKIATGQVADGTLTVTFVDPVDPKTGQSADMPAVVRGEANLDVEMNSSLVKSKASTLEWEVQKPAEQTTAASSESSVSEDSAPDDTAAQSEEQSSSATPRTVTLRIPSKAAVLKQLGLANAEDSDGNQSDDPEADKKDETALQKDTAAANLAVKHTTSGSSGKAKEFTTLWADNNSAERPSVDNLNANNEYRLYFQVDGQTYPLTTDGKTISQDAIDQLGLAQGDLDRLFKDDRLVTVEKTGVNEYHANSVTNLPDSVTTYRQKTDADGNPVVDEQGQPVYDESNGTTKPITYVIRHEGMTGGANVYGSKYQVADKSLYPDYVVDGEKECLQLLKSITFNVVARMGNDDLNDPHTWVKNQTLHVDKAKGAGEADEHFPLKIDMPTLLDDNRLTINIDTDKRTATYGPMLWPQYHPDGTPFTYSLTQSEEKKMVTETEGDHTFTYTDYLQVWYDNSATANHGSDISAAYSGGIVTVTRAGTTSYDAKKVWLDDNPADRPETTYSLWRYSSKEGAKSIEAAHVLAKDSTEYITLTMSAKENQKSDSFDLGKLIREKYGDNLELAKYDQDGYPYIYLLCEDQPSGYERIFGTVNKDGKISDTVGPNYYQPDRKDDTENWQFASKDDQGNLVRPTLDNPKYGYNDVSVYNGGTVTNRRTDNVTESLTKTWKVGAFQDQFKNVTVRFQAQRMLKSDAEYSKELGYWVPKNSKTTDWQDVPESEGGVKDVTDWSAERLTQTISGTFPQYDSQGREYVYQWIEKDVAQNGKWLSEDGSFMQDGRESRFAMDVTDADGTTSMMTFTGSWDEDNNRLVNEFRNSTTTAVDKYWWVAGKDGEEGHWSQDAKPYGDSTPKSVTVKLIQNDTVVGKFHLTGDTANKGSFRIDGAESDSDYEETTPWHLKFTNLPLYDSEGRKYTYMVLEEATPGYSSQHEFGKDEYGDSITTIRNKPVGEGEWTPLHVTKQWIDDGNASARKPVKVKLIAKQNLVTADGTIIVKQGDQIGDDITLDEANVWYYETGVAAAHVQESDGMIRALNWKKDIAVTEVGSADYVVITKQEAENDAANCAAGTSLCYGYGTLLRNWNDDDSRLVTKSYTDATDSYAYQITYGVSDAKDALKVINRRLGQVDIDIDKTWVDQGADAKKRPKSSFTVTPSSTKVTFSQDVSGNIVANVSGGNKQLQLYRHDQSGSEAKLNVADGVAISEDGHSLILTVDTTQDKSDYEVYALPKYEGTGAVITYTVTEKWDGDHTDYTHSLTDSNEHYISNWHFRDAMNYSFENKRTNVKDVTFHTHWFDAYVKEELNQRFDVYLTLYKAVCKYDEHGNVETDADGKPVIDHMEVVPDYGNYKWQPEQSESDDGSKPDSSYNQQATIKNLPKYDSHGREIVYYASASTKSDSATIENLNYLPHWFSDEYFANADSDEVQDAANWTAVGNTASDKPNGTNADPGNGRGWAIREDGTFNFKISSNTITDGTKIWINVPGNVKQADLPKITVYLQRKMAGGKYVDGKWVAQGESEASKEWHRLRITTPDNGKTYHVQNYADGDAPDYAVADGRTAVAWTSDLREVSTNSYQYKLGTYGGNTFDQGTGDLTALPRYDSNGRRYEYRAREVMDGLLGTPGGFDVSDMVGDHNNGGTSESAVSKVYKIQHGETSSFALRNTYDSKKGKLTVTKEFSGEREENDHYPDVTFTLYRQYQGKDDNGNLVMSDAALVKRCTITADQFKASSTTKAAVSGGVFGGLGLIGGLLGGATGGLAGAGQSPLGLTSTTPLAQAGGTAGSVSNSASCTFENLDIYAPTGQYWQYFVGETTIGGYPADEVKVIVGDGFGGGAVQDFTAPDGSKLSDYVHLSDDGEAKATVTYDNTYKPNKVSLNGKKVWIDAKDIWGIRPSKDEFLKGITVERVSLKSGQRETVKLQTTSASAENYFTWTTEDNSADYQDQTWNFTVTNLDRWAPDGSLWRYTFTETVSSGYVITEGGTSVSATSPAEGSNSADLPQWRNAVRGVVSVKKNWDDGNNRYGLRPTSVQVLLQAKVGTGKWQNAYAALKEATGLTDQDMTNGRSPITADSVKQTLAGSGWSYTWWDVPYLVKSKSNATVQTVQYRVVETAIGKPGESGYQNLGEPTDENITYAATVLEPYSPTHKTDEPTNDWDRGTNTTITNTLNRVTIYGKKTWDDQGNKWASRPGTSTDKSQWSVAYKLQRKIASDQDWAWVTKYNTTVNSGFDGNVVSVTITGTRNDAEKAFEDLPKTDTSGNAYAYRLIEVLPVGYKVEGATVVGENDTQKLVVNTTDTAMSETSPQNYTNKLLTTKLTGIKKWNDFGSGVVDKDKSPQDLGVRLQLQRRTGDGAWQDVSIYVNGEKTTSPQPDSWTRNNDGSWTFEYAGLPKVDRTTGADYQYRAKEITNISGFYATYGSNNDSQIGDSTQNSAQDGWTNPVITNTATRFTFDKLVEAAEGETSSSKINGPVEFKIWKASGDKSLVVTWSRDATGKVTITPTDGSNVKGNDSGYIIAMPGGNYVGAETKVPTGYASVGKFDLKVDGSNGKITVSNKQSVSMAANTEGNVIVVTATDPVYRAHVSLTKVVKDLTPTVPVPGMTFDLYKGAFDKDKADGGGVKIVSSITTDDKGQWTSVQDTAQFVAENKDAAFGDFAKYYNQLKDGLPAGDYYFLETGSSPNTNTTETSALDKRAFAFTLKAPSDATDASEPTSADNGDHGKTVEVTAENPEFNAAIQLRKIDAETGNAIDGAEFKLVYTPEGAADAVEKAFSGLKSGKTYEVKLGTDGQIQTSLRESDGTTGVLKLTKLKKGNYALYETANKGYIVSTDVFVAKFTIGNENDKGDYDLAKENDRSTIKASDVHSSLKNDRGLENTPLRGRAKLTKYADKVETGRELNGAKFKLQKKSTDTEACNKADGFDKIDGNNGGCWADTGIIGLETGKTYVANTANDGVESTEGADSSSKGVLLISNLKWGTYRFVETDPAPGYIRYDENGNPRVSSEFTIDADAFGSATSQEAAGILTPMDAGNVINFKAITALPLSGSRGIRAWLIAGACLFLLAAATAAMAVYRRHRKL